MRLEAVSDDEEKRARDRVTHETWGGKLGLEAWVAREDRLRHHAWAQAAMTTWFWRGEDGAVLSSLETFAVPSRVGRAAGVSWEIASVYTAPELRRQGHARRMMDALVARARSEGVQACTLYSDVDKHVYEVSGFVARPAEDLVFPPAAGDAATGVDALLPEAVEVDAPDGPYTLWPSPLQLDWHLERSRLYRELWKRPAPPAVGARKGDGVAVWYVDWYQDRLLLLALDAMRAAEAEALVLAARRLAGTLHLREVRIWAQPWSWPGRDDLGGDRVARVGSLPMIAPLAAGLRADDWKQIPRGVWV